MFRRWLIANAVAGLVMTALLKMFVPAPAHLLAAVHEDIMTYARESAFLSPLIFRTLRLQDRL